MGSSCNTYSNYICDYVFIHSEFQFLQHDMNSRDFKIFSRSEIIVTMK